jgi:O-antigen ligase/tetratricopeptide (TPR) repeat protein
MAIVVFYAFHDFWWIRADLLIRGLVAVGVAGAVLGLASIIDDYSAWRSLVAAVEGQVGTLALPPSVPRISGVGDHVNLLAMSLNLALPFALAIVLVPAFRFERVLGLMACVLILVALFFTVSRGAWLGTMAGLSLLAVLLYFRDRSLTGRLPRLSGTGLAATAAVLFAVVLLGSIVFLARWESRPEWLFRASLSPRQDAVSVGLDIFRDRPVLGAGPQTYAFLYGIYSGEYPIENIHAHNGYVQAAANLGLVGLATLAAGALVLVWALAAAYRQGDPRRRAWIAACLASLATLAVHSLTDSPNQSKTALLSLAVVLAIAMRLAPVALPPARLLSLGNVPRLMVLLLVPALVGGWIFSARGHASYNDSLDRLLEGDYVAAARHALEAADRDPDYAAYHFQAGVAQAINYLILLDRGGDAPSALLEAAVASFRRGLELEPRSAIGWTNLALALRRQNEVAAAIDSAHMAINRAPRDGAIAGVAATILEWGGDHDGALTAFGIAMTHDPALTQSPYWSAGDSRLAVREEAMDRAFVSSCQKTRVTALYGRFGDDLQALTEACRRQVDADGRDARARSDLAVGLYALGQQEEALREADRAIERASDNAFVRTARGIILNGQGDIARVRHELLLGAHLGDPDAALLLFHTYAGAPESLLGQNLRLLSDAAAPPDVVVEKLREALPSAAPLTFEHGLQHYLLGILYYRVRFQRESPPSLLIPDDWIELASPRSLLIMEALDAASRLGGD